MCRLVEHSTCFKHRPAAKDTAGLNLTTVRAHDVSIQTFVILSSVGQDCRASGFVAVSRALVRAVVASFGGFP